jgi:hypothetical protein
LLLLMAMKNPVFWDIPPCSGVKVYRHFGGTYCLHLHDWRISSSRNQCQRQVTMAFNTQNQWNCGLRTSSGILYS